ncbi:lectin-like [Leucoraja erinacea]|uniref:lectin-like n=1 Tax=Leucoraja erinaceus TaxID=7782 RepID=UPI0024549936|nr:lectin-like [Leucoraja erinacea]
MMLVWVLVLTALLASDVAETTDSLGSEKTQNHLEKRDIVKGPCDEDWFHYPTLNSCYRRFSDKKTWSDAKVFCNHQPHSGHLATITSSDHNIFINNVIYAVNNKKPSTWIGLNDRCEERNFTWTDGSASSYRHWLLGEPNDINSEDCVVINFREVGVWNDISCVLKHDFVCSYKLDCN